MTSSKLNTGTLQRIGTVAMMSFAVVGPVLALRATQLGSQKKESASHGPERFEVASIRLVPAKERGFTSIGPPGNPRFTAHNVTLPVLIGLAYGIDSGRQIVGEPGWLDTEEYDISAKAENDDKLSYDDLKSPLRQLLQERLHLACHHETRMHKGYALVVAKDGPKLHADTIGSTGAYILQDGIKARNIPVSMLASLLSRPMGAPVVDKTGIAGSFDFDLKYDPNSATQSTLPSLPTALEDDLGLKLVRQEVSEDVIVIDHIDRIPTEN